MTHTPTICYEHHRIPSQIYGHPTLEEIEAMCRETTQGDLLEFRQTNSEAQLIDWINQACDAADGLVINLAGLGFRPIPPLDERGDVHGVMAVRDLIVDHR